MGPTWATTWVPYGQPIWAPHGFCNRAPCGSHMGKPIWVEYGTQMGPTWALEQGSIWDPYGPHMGYGTGLDMGPIWVLLGTCRLYLDLGHKFGVTLVITCYYI